MNLHTIKITPGNITASAAAGEDLLGALVASGVYLTAPCGGQGTCGRCRVKLHSGNAPMKPGSALTESDIAGGMRLACRTAVKSDLAVEIPDDSRLRALALSDSGERVTAQRLDENEELIRRLSDDEPICRNLYLELMPPSLDDPASDLTRLSRAVKAATGMDISHVEYDALVSIPSVLRSDNWRVTATLLDRSAACRIPDTCPQGFQLIQIHPGKCGPAIVLALDIGTTTVKAQLVDTASRTVLAEDSAYNIQINNGEDVISRIIYAGKNGGLNQLQKAVADTTNQLLNNLLNISGIDRNDISGVYACGNTTMTQLFLGVDPKYIREEPYTPAANVYSISKASVTGLDVPAHAFLYVFPCMASYVGGDITAGVLAAGIHDNPQMTLYIDIGTNGEIVVGNNEWLMTASCSAGPAFEGGGLRNGMRASTGAIEGFFLDPETLEPSVLVIGRDQDGGARPLGICGSGIIAVLAELLKYGILSRNGKLDIDCGAPRVRRGETGGEYVLATADESGKEILLTEADIDNVIRAKAAMYAGYRTLLDHAGLSFGDLDRVIITGSFGSYIDIEKAIAIGLLPELPREMFFYLPNGALAGARSGALGGGMLREAETVARMMTNIELSIDNKFMDAYMAAMFLPHTHAEEFPIMTGRLDALAGKRVSA